ncbi:FAD-binding oxidoreductase [Micromonospora sp. WMMD1082]|uniref:FAD-binding oxidoreductase n=1 Tax=Micromonospora sp. WMMD1082 TaxID=3016104 RepID=UPI002416F3A1|nr:FAD-binding oxidoreductase [Micromonospora sp. WMMD1082]MDG4795721.1 FAD-binding oxidoreductase [Micromonospora sp. WMMD1082]
MASDDTLSKILAEPEVVQLSAAVAGPVFLPGDEGYDADRATYNLLTPQRPAVVVGVVNADDVRETVRFARRNSLPVAVQATGHGVGVPADGAVLINTSRMTGVTIDPDARIARVEAGVRWQRVIDEAAKYGLAAINGSSPTVGVVGYTLGGGHSPFLGRSYGYAADHVTAVDIVTPDGELRTVTADLEPELFWAVRGGKANFGVVTAIEFRVFPLERLYGGALFFPGSQARQVLQAWRSWIEDTPDELTSSIALLRLPPVEAVPEPLRGQLVVHVRIAHLGSAEEGARLVAPLREAGTVLLDSVVELPYTAVASIHNDPVDPLPVCERSTLLRDLTPAALDRIVGLAGEGSEVPVTVVEIRHLAGALRRAPQVPNAVANREAAFLLFVASVTALDAVPAHVAYHARIIEELAEWDTGRAFANFLTPGNGAADHVASAYPPGVYTRLVELKRRWDPDNLFRFTHTIHTD